MPKKRQKKKLENKKPKQLNVYILVLVVVILIGISVYINLMEKPSGEESIEEREQITVKINATAETPEQPKTPVKVFKFEKFIPYAEGHVYKVEWADYDKDGDLDLAAANYNRQNYIFVNENWTFTKNAQFGSG